MLKGIYFPHTDFLSATKGGRASWGWSSLLEGRAELVKGFCWRIGDGKDVRIWEDPWIPDLPNFKLTAMPLNLDLSVWFVEDIIENGRWKLDGISTLLTDDEREAILSIPISCHPHSDKLVWARCKDGKYSVKDGYKERLKLSSESQIGVGCSSPVSKELWKALWKLKVPPEVKHFLWKACSAALPTKENLFKRKCAAVSTCQLCNEHCETVEHLLFFCDWAKRAWFGCSFTVRFESIGFDSFEKWCSKWLLDEVALDDSAKSFLAIMCWELWKEMCNAIFQNCSTDPILTGNRAVSLHSQFWKCLENSEVIPNVATSTVDASMPHWKCPEGDVVKFNSDGSYCSNSSAGVGIVARNQFGQVVDGFAGDVKVSSALAAEAMALHKACMMADALNLKDVVFEVDCKELVDAVTVCSSKASWRCNAVFSDLISFFGSHPHFSLKLILRQANMAADFVARLAARKMCPLGWVSSPPSSLALILSSDVSSGVDETGVG